MNLSVDILLLYIYKFLISAVPKPKDVCNPFGFFKIEFHANAVSEMKLSLNLPPCAKTGPSEEQKLVALEQFLQKENEKKQEKFKRKEEILKRKHAEGDRLDAKKPRLFDEPSDAQNEVGADEFVVVDELNPKKKSRGKNRREQNSKKQFKKQVQNTINKYQSDTVGLTPQGTHKMAPNTKPKPSMQIHYKNKAVPRDQWDTITEGWTKTQTKKFRSNQIRLENLAATKNGATAKN